ncbi:hypothetical protein MASR2M44_19240 [Bacteroidota bacterium]
MDSIRTSVFRGLIIHGLLFLLFGLLALFMQQDNLYSAMFYLGFLFLATGFLYLSISFLLRKTSETWFLGWIWALFDLGLGTLILVKVEQATDIYTNIIGAFASLMALGTFLSAIYLKPYRMVLIINGIVSLSFGLLIIFNPFPAKFLTVIVGLYTLLLGLFLVYTAFLIKSSKKEIKPETES